ncbi:MAG: hypothetical protein JNK58_08715 [Phycisphaerae bacterium]|nr:hypothetical protein [Phycisphaerae bacterium]
MTAVLCVVLAAGNLVCCSGSKPRSSALRAADMEVSCDEIRQQFASSGLIAGRTPDSPEIVLVPGAMENRSYERLSKLDRYGATVRLLNDPAMRELFAHANIRVVEPATDAGVYRALGLSPDPPARGLSPTHILQASFSSAQRQAAGTARATSDLRKDLFLIQFDVVDLKSRERVWSGSSEFARVAYGELID